MEIRVRLQARFRVHVNAAGVSKWTYSAASSLLGPTSVVLSYVSLSSYQLPLAKGGFSSGRVGTPNLSCVLEMTM